MSLKPFPNSNIVSPQVLSLLDKFVNNQIIRFGIVGGITAALDYAILFALVDFYDINYLISSAAGFLAGSTLNYVLSIIFVFKSGRFNTKAIEFTVFIVFTALGLLLNHFIMWVGVDVLLANYLFIKIISLILVTLFNFLTKKYLVFKN